MKCRWLEIGEVLIFLWLTAWYNTIRHFNRNSKSQIKFWCANMYLHYVMYLHSSTVFWEMITNEQLSPFKTDRKKSSQALISIEDNSVGITYTNSLVKVDLIWFMQISLTRLFKTQKDPISHFNTFYEIWVNWKYDFRSLLTWLCNTKLARFFSRAKTVKSILNQGVVLLLKYILTINNFAWM